MIIEKMIGIITDNLELVVARPVPAKLIAFAYAKKDKTNNRPSTDPKIKV